MCRIYNANTWKMVAEESESRLASAMSVLTNLGYIKLYCTKKGVIINGMSPSIPSPQCERESEEMGDTKETRPFFLFINLN